MVQGWPSECAHDGGQGVSLQVDQACPDHVQHRVRFCFQVVAGRLFGRQAALLLMYWVIFLCLQGPSDSWARQSLLETDPSRKGKSNVWVGRENFTCLNFFSRLLRLQATSFKSPMVKSLLKTYWISSKAKIKQKHNNIVATWIVCQLIEAFPHQELFKKIQKTFEFDEPPPHPPHSHV